MWRFIFVILSCIILAAHFFRADLLALSILCILSVFLSFYRKRWVPQLLQWFLFLGSLEWLRTLIVFTRERVELGQPWVRLAIIIGSVMLLTLFSAFLMRNKKILEKYTL
jgi:hypothetical protein